MKYDLVVVGAGLFGSIIADLATNRGLTVCVVSEHRPREASACAACLMKPTWFSNLPNANEALKTLDMLYGLKTIEFDIGPLKIAPVHWVDPEKVLKIRQSALREDIEGKVTSVLPNIVLLSSGKVLKCRWVVVATGQWVPELFPEYKGELIPKFGAAFRFKGQLKNPFIRPWAPFKQIVAFNIDGYEVWAGDGTALNKWSDSAENVSENRVCKALPPKIGQNTPEVRVGGRPYMKLPSGQPCLLEETYIDVWVASAGAKNGTIGAAWAANELMKRLKW